MLRLLRGEYLETVSRSLSVTASTLRGGATPYAVRRQGLQTTRKLLTYPVPDSQHAWIRPSESTYHRLLPVPITPALAIGRSEVALQGSVTVRSRGVPRSMVTPLPPPSLFAPIVGLGGGTSAAEAVFTQYISERQISPSKCLAIILASPICTRFFAGIKCNLILYEEPGRSSSSGSSGATSCSWLNAVEGFFAKLSRRRLKRRVFRSVADLQAAINRFINETNDDPKPFVWTANPDKIIGAVKRGHQPLDSIH